MADIVNQPAVEKNNPGEGTPPETAPNPAENPNNTPNPAPTGEASPTSTTEPIEYKAEDYKYDENPKFTKEDLDAFTAFSIKEKMSPEMAKKVIDYEAQIIKKNDEDLDKLHKKWESELKDTYKEDLKNVEVNVARVYETVDKDGKFKGLLDLTGVTGHPDTIAFLKAIGDKVLEKPAVTTSSNNSAPEEKELKDFLYPDFKLNS